LDQVAEQIDTYYLDDEIEGLIERLILIRERRKSPHEVPES
jgi:hypothetical protein